MSAKDSGQEVGRLIAAAFQLARERNEALAGKWIEISARIGGLLPQSLLMASVQRDGELDVVLRSMEDSYTEPSEDQDPVSFLQFHYHKLLAEMWVGSMYETLRLLIERRLAASSNEFRALARDFRLLRIPLEKHEITGDRKLGQPLELRRVPPNNDSSDLYEYSKDDPTRAHIMPSGVSARGSVMWQVIDVEHQGVRWIERRDLSDRVIAVWSTVPPT